MVSHANLSPTLDRCIGRSGTAAIHLRELAPTLPRHGTHRHRDQAADRRQALPRAVADRILPTAGRVARAMTRTRGISRAPTSPMTCAVASGIGARTTSWRVAFNGSSRLGSDARAIRGALRRRLSHLGFHPCYGLAETALFVSGGRGGAPTRGTGRRCRRPQTDGGRMRPMRSRSAGARRRRALAAPGNDGESADLGRWRERHPGLLAATAQARWSSRGSTAATALPASDLGFVSGESSSADASGRHRHPGRNYDADAINAPPPTPWRWPRRGTIAFRSSPTAKSNSSSSTSWVDTVLPRCLVRWSTPCVARPTGTRSNMRHRLRARGQDRQDAGEPSCSVASARRIATSCGSGTVADAPQDARRRAAPVTSKAIEEWLMARIVPGSVPSAAVTPQDALRPTSSIRPTPWRWLDLRAGWTSPSHRRCSMNLDHRRPRAFLDRESTAPARFAAEAPVDRGTRAPS